MKITLTDINIAMIILQNISKAEYGDGVFTIELPKNITLKIDYTGNDLDSRCIQIIYKGMLVKDWNGRNIVIDEIENCLKNSIN